MLKNLYLITKFINMLTRNDIGKKIVMFRKPNTKEWNGIGKITILCKMGEVIVLKEIIDGCTNPHIKTSKGGWYPACCFKLFEESYEIY